jgi:hypothetical protein
VLDWQTIEVGISGEAPNTCVTTEHVVVTIDDTGPATYSLVTSRPRPYRLSTDDFPTHLVAEVDRRLGSTDELGYLNGARKGRVLYLLLNGDPIAAMTYHVASGYPLMVLGADARNDSPDGGWAEVEILLTGIRAVAGALGLTTDRLDWDTDCGECAGLAELHGFNDRYPEDEEGRKHQMEATF